jgi:hypothetical protein
LVGIGGGAGLRRTCGPFLDAGCEVLLLAGGGSGRVGRDRVDALDGARPRSVSASRLPSKFAVWAECVGNGGTIIFLAGGFCDAAGKPCCKLVVELAIELGVLAPLKSTVRARCEPRAGGGSGLPLLLDNRLTSTQSGSGLGVKGLLGRLGLGMCPSDGGCVRALAGRPCEDEHPSCEWEENIGTIVKPPFPSI